MPRYISDRIFNNNLEFYEFLREKRNGVRSITQYATPRLINPTVFDRASIATIAHIWKYGDRYYNLARQHYGDPTYWWVIAWWNARPTEANVSPGNVIMIPLDLEEVLEALGTD